MLNALLITAAAAVGQASPAPPAAPAAAPPAVVSQTVVVAPVHSHGLFGGGLFNHGGCTGSAPAPTHRLFGGGLFNHGGGCTGSTPVVASTHFAPHSGGLFNWFHGLKSSHHTYEVVGYGCTGGTATIVNPAPSTPPATTPVPAKPLPNSPDAAPKKTTSNDASGANSVSASTAPVAGAVTPRLAAPPAILTREVALRP